MDVAELAPGLWRWTTAHPDWTPEQGGAEGWERAVSSVYCEAGGEVMLIDPLVPVEPAERERFWNALDSDVGRAAGTSVLLTCAWHARSAAEVAERYGARRWEPGAGAPPAAVEAIDAALDGEVLLYLSFHAALVAGDTLLGDRARGVRLCPESWLGGRDTGDVRRGLRERLNGRAIRFVLPAHGDAVIADAAGVLARALDG